MTVAVEQEMEQPPASDRSGRAALGLVAAAWAVILVLLLRHREVISSDTLSNYVHVWYIAERVWHGHGIPFHMPVLAHGDALAFPYGFIPWMFSVLLWPLLHEWSVTLALGIGFVGMVWATFWAFPEVRRGWWAAGTLLNPALAMGLMLGQLPFMWAAAMLLIGIGCWRLDRKGWALVWITLAQLTHAPILVPLVGCIVLLRLRYEPDRRGLLVRWLATVALSLPAIVLVVISPVTSQTGPLISLWIEVETLFLRAFIVIVPVGMVLFQRWSAREHVDRPTTARRVAPAIFALLIFGQVVIALGAGMRVGWGAMFRDPDRAAIALPHSAHFEPGKTYRVLSQADGKYAPYAAVRAGATLDSEFFPESLNWRSFKSEQAYAKFLVDRKVDFVALYARYDRRKTNEHTLLDRMHACTDGITISRVEHTLEYDLYAVHPCSE
jgi:hypothetical protein